MNKEMIGRFINERGNSVEIVDFLRSGDRACCFAKVLGNTQILKTFWLEIAKKANNSKGLSSQNYILPTSISMEIFRSNGGLQTLLLSGLNRYSKIETPLDYGFSCYTIYRDDLFDNPMIIFADNSDRESLYKVFKKWVSKIPLPIPNDEKLLLKIFDDFEYQKLFSYQKSEGGGICGVFFSSTISDNDYEIVRNLVEEFYKPSSISKEAM